MKNKLLVLPLAKTNLDSINPLLTIFISKPMRERTDKFSF